MDHTYDNGLKIKEIIDHIDRCQEEKLKDPTVNIEAPGLGWIGSSYY